MRRLLLAAVLLALAACDEPLYLVSRDEAIPSDAVKMTPELDTWPPILHSSEWEQPVPMPGPINTAGAEDSPFITPDGEWFFSWFTPDVSVPPEKQLLDGATGIYWSRRSGGEWTEPERVLLSDDLALDGGAFFRRDTLWFCSARVGNYRELDYYVAVLRDGRWTDVRNAGATLNRDYSIGEMHISADGRTMYCARTADKGGEGGYDLWSLARNATGWDEPVHLGATVNCSGDDGWPFLSQDGTELWFTRMNYEGQAEPGPTIWRSRQDTTGAWSPPELILSQFAGEPALDEAGNLYFTHHFFTGADPIRMIEADYYVCYRK